MTSATDIAAMTADEQYALVYAGIQAVAANCDGAVTEDGVGFNGQDTKFGKRIAAVPFDMWTDDVKQEAARIALTYKAQILSYIGIDMFELTVVKEATGHGTNRQARDDARSFERRAVRISADGTVACDFPFNARLKDALKGTGARWNGQDKTWDFRPGTLTREALDLVRSEFVTPDEVFDCLAEQLAKAAMPPRDPATAVHGFMLSGEVVFNFPYNPAQKDAIKAAGARWNGADKTWRVRADNPSAGAVVAVARKVGLVVAKEVDAALPQAAAEVLVKLDRKATLVGASRLSRPEDVSPEFLALVAAAVAR